MTIAARMQKSSFIWLGLAMLGLFLPRDAGAREIAGKIVSLSGKVLVRNTLDPAPKMAFAKVGDEIAEGSVINTDSSGSAKLLLTDKSIIDLGPSTLFKVDEYALKHGADRKVALTMDYGKIRAAVNSKVSPMGKYGVRAKSVTMGVRGTEFVVMTDLANFAASPVGGGAAPAASAAANSGTAITVVHGKVEVADENTPRAKPVAATAGTQVKVADTPAEGRNPASKAAPTVTQLSAAEVAQVKSEAKQADKTFVQAVVMDNSPGGGAETMAAIGGMFAEGGGFKPPETFDIFQNPLGQGPTNYNTTLNAVPVNVRVVFVK